MNIPYHTMCEKPNISCVIGINYIMIARDTEARIKIKTLYDIKIVKKSKIVARGRGVDPVGTKSQTLPISCSFP